MRDQLIRLAASLGFECERTDNASLLRKQIQDGHIATLTVPDDVPEWFLDIHCAHDGTLLFSEWDDIWDPNGPLSATGERAELLSRVGSTMRMIAAATAARVVTTDGVRMFGRRWLAGKQLELRLDQEWRRWPDYAADDS